MAHNFLSVDEHPGVPPDIQTDERGTTYRFCRVGQGAYLTIRSDNDGQVFAAIPEPFGTRVDELERRL